MIIASRYSRLTCSIISWRRAVSLWNVNKRYGAGLNCGRKQVAQTVDLGKPTGSFGQERTLASRDRNTYSGQSSIMDA